jgi:hypothetical protein
MILVGLGWCTVRNERKSYGQGKVCCLTGSGLRLWLLALARAHSKTREKKKTLL